MSVSFSKLSLSHSELTTRAKKESPSLYHNLKAFQVVDPQIFGKAMRAFLMDRLLCSDPYGLLKLPKDSKELDVNDLCLEINFSELQSLEDECDWASVREKGAKNTISHPIAAGIYKQYPDDTSADHFFSMQRAIDKINGMLADLAQCRSARFLNLSGLGLTEIPETVTLSDCRKLDISYNPNLFVSTRILKNRKLRVLVMDVNQWLNFPEKIIDKMETDNIKVVAYPDSEKRKKPPTMLVRLEARVSTLFSTKQAEEKPEAAMKVIENYWSIKNLVESAEKKGDE